MKRSILDPYLNQGKFLLLFAQLQQSTPFLRRYFSHVKTDQEAARASWVTGHHLEQPHVAERVRLDGWRRHKEQRRRRDSVLTTRVKYTPRCEHCRRGWDVLHSACLTQAACGVLANASEKCSPQSALLQAKVRCASLVLRAGTIQTRVRSILSDVPSGWITASAGETHSTSRRHHLLLITPVRCRAATHRHVLGWRSSGA